MVNMMYRVACLMVLALVACGPAYGDSQEASQDLDVAEMAVNHWEAHYGQPVSQGCRSMVEAMPLQTMGTQELQTACARGAVQGCTLARDADHVEVWLVPGADRWVAVHELTHVLSICELHRMDQDHTGPQWVGLL